MNNESLFILGKYRGSDALCQAFFSFFFGRDQARHPPLAFRRRIKGFLPVVETGAGRCSGAVPRGRGEFTGGSRVRKGSVYGAAARPRADRGSLAPCCSASSGLPRDPAPAPARWPAGRSPELPGASSRCERGPVQAAHAAVDGCWEGGSIGRPIGDVPPGGCPFLTSAGDCTPAWP